MPVEIERKFLVTCDAWRAEATGSRRIVQGYLASDPTRAVRIRIAGDEAWLTIKGAASGISRAEFEYPVPAADAGEMLALCLPGSIEKIRHLVPHDNQLWEVDEFLGDNAGLVIAEIELDAPEQAIVLPSWAGCDVTHDPRYLNANLAKHPYRQWPQ